jgi:Uma2 family endonuclease
LPPAKRPHNQVAKALYHLILKTVELDRVEREEGYQMSTDTWLVPDVSVTWPDQALVNQYFQGSPMIAVEVVSPGNTADEIGLKVTAYLQSGAAEVWIVSPGTRRMMFHTATSVRSITDGYHCETIPVVVKLSDILS